MKSRRGLDESLERRLMSSNDPLTHFFYERAGECTVPPCLLVENGIHLWHEAVASNDAHDNSYLWEEAQAIINGPRERPFHSWVEWVRRSITLGGTVPKRWGSHRPYPYKGLLISAVYFLEARRLCEQDVGDRVWHIIALAYYHLGLNSSRSTTRNTSRAAQVMHAGRTEKIRAMVLGALNKIRADGTATSISAAKDQVVDLLRKHEDKFKDWLNEFEVLVPDTTKGRSAATEKNDVFVRIRNMLDNWSLPSGPYPEIAEAFSQFSKRKSRGTDQSTSKGTTSENFEVEEPAYFLRLISFTDEGTFTEKLSTIDEEVNQETTSGSR